MFTKKKIIWSAVAIIIIGAGAYMGIGVFEFTQFKKDFANGNCLSQLKTKPLNKKFGYARIKNKSLKLKLLKLTPPYALL